MDTLNTSTHALRAMLALDELRHFSLAAERCHVTQSALSQTVAKLELELGLRLVDRDRRRVVLTPEGQRFVATARQVIHELDAMGAELRDRAQLRRGRLSICASPPFAAHLLPPLIGEFRRMHPGIQLDLFDRIAPRCLEILRERGADFAILNMDTPVAGVQHRVLYLESFVLVCPRGHALSSRRKVTLADLKGCRYIRFARSGNIARHLEHAMRDIRLDDTGLEVEQIATIAGLVANGLGVSVVPRVNAPYFNADKVAIVPVEEPGLNRPIHLVWLASREFSPAAAAFVALMDAAVREKAENAAVRKRGNRA